MNPGILIGTVALLVGIGSLAAALILRSAKASEKSAGQTALWLVYRFGLVLLFFVAAATGWDAFQTKDWSKAMQAAGFMAMALSALVVAQNATPTKPNP